MISEHDFDALVAGFYAAATTSISWDEALAGMRRAFNARAAVVQTVDLPTGRIVQLSQSSELKPEAFLTYAQHWHEIDPRRRHLLAHLPEVIGRWWHCQDHIGAEVTDSHPFYRHFLPSQQTRYLATSMHQPAPHTVTSFALELPADRGPLNAEERQWAERLSRHFDEALRAHQRVRQLASQALAGHALLDAFAYPMWLLDAERHVFHANRAARALQAAGGLAESRDGRLLWQALRVDRALGEQLMGLGARARHGHRAVIDARVSKADPPSWLHLHVLEPRRVLGGVFGERTLALLTFFDPQQMGELDPFALSEMFGMTPTEGRVAALLAEGVSAAAVARRLHCSEHTVRTHLRQVLHKLGASRLADAVRVLRQGEVLWSLPKQPPVAAELPG